jgi:uroporphyrinogen decarboxylase
MRKFAGFHAPDPEITDGLRKIDWTAIERTAAAENRCDFNFFLGLPHGHTFLRAQDIRGYEDFICDLSDDDGDIIKMLDMISKFNMKLINRFIACRPDVISIPEDLGMQNSPMLSPKLFKKYIAPYYLLMTEPVKRAGILVHEHSDGYIMDLLDDLIMTGGDVINLQDLVNGIDNLAGYAKGRMSIDLDIDRQNITVCGTPRDIHDHIRECVVKLGSREGGLSLTYQPWPPVPIANLDAVFSAMEKYCVTDYIYR